MWIKDYREREGLELYQLQQRVNTYSRLSQNPLQAPVSAQLIHMLEEQKDAVTHPHIADCIAAVCGATAKQRDMIVHRIHRGEWEPTDETRKIAKQANESNIGDVLPETIAQIQQNIRLSVNKHAVVKIDMYGNTINRFESVAKAAELEGINKNTINTRCMGKVKDEFNDYYDTKGNLVTNMYTWRYADVWDAMTQKEKIADIEKARKVSGI